DHAAECRHREEDACPAAGQIPGRTAAAGLLRNDGLPDSESDAAVSAGRIRRVPGRHRGRDRQEPVHRLRAPLRSDQRADSDRHFGRHRARAQGGRLIPLGPLPAAVPPSWYLILSAILFALGVLGFLLRRNIITVFMSIELMLNAVNLSFVTFSYVLKRVDGHIFSFFVMVVAAAEAAVGLAIILTVFKNRQTLEIDEVSSLKN